MWKFLCGLLFLLLLLVLFLTGTYIATAHAPKMKERCWTSNQYKLEHCKNFLKQ